MTDPAPTTPADPAATAEPATTEPGADQLGDAGKQALDRMKAERNAANAEIKKLQDQMAALAPLGELAKALGVKPSQGKNDVEALTAQVTEMRHRQAEAELRAVRLEVAADKGLTPQQAARLQGATRYDLEADADALKALFPAPSSTPGTPAPDPTQGSRGGTSDIEARLAQAQKDGRTSDVIRLKTELAEQTAKANK